MKRKTEEELRKAYTQLCDLSAKCDSVKDLMRLSGQSLCQIKTI